jgi:cytoskeletal protein CcmA (bactofilin family)
MAQSSVIGHTTVIRGNMRGQDSLEVLGRVEGDVTSHADVLVGDQGVVHGNITGAAVQVGGEVNGDLTGSDSIVLAEGARVVGDLRAPRIGITEGALIRGSVQTDSGPAPAAQRTPSHAQAEPERGRAPIRAEPAPRREPAKPMAKPQAPAKRAAARTPPPPVVPALSKKSRGRKKKARAR